MNEPQDEKRQTRPRSIHDGGLPPELEVDWPPATRPPRVEDFIKDLNEVSILRRFRF